MRLFHCFFAATLPLVCIGTPLCSVANAQDAKLGLSIEFLNETIRQADEIEDQKTRSAAQWKLVWALLGADLPGEAFDQAMKLSQSNPHTFILSMNRIGNYAKKNNDAAMVTRTFTTAARVDQETGNKYTSNVVDMGFKLDRPLDEIIRIATNSKKSQPAFSRIRNWLARKGRVDEAYQFAATYLPGTKILHHHRQIGYSCASVKHYDYYAKHDYFGQAIDVIHKMPPGKERDHVISTLVSNLMYTTNRDTVSDEHLKLATHWAQQIQDDAKRGAAKRNVMQRERAPKKTVQQLEKQFAAAKLREEKSQILTQIFHLLIAAEDLDQSDKILPRQLQLIKDQPREKQISAFGAYDDETAIKHMTWTHERTMVQTLAKVGKLQEAKARLQKMSELPEHEPMLFIGNLAGIRQQLMLQLGEWDELKKMLAATNPGQPHAYALIVTQDLIRKGRLKEAAKEFQAVLDQPQEVVFPADKINHFSATVHEELAVALVESGDVETAVLILNQIPEHEYLTQPFRSFGRTLCADKDLAKLKPWLEKLPHQTARVYTRLGAWYAAIKNDK